VMQTLDLDAIPFEHMMNEIRRQMPSPEVEDDTRTSVLFLGAVPHSGQNLELEHRAIESILQANPKISFHAIPDVHQDDLFSCFDRYSPHLVHFSGHGDSAGNLRLLDAQNEAQPVSPEFIAQAAHGNIRLMILVLNACMSFTQAEQLIPSVDCVIAVSDRVRDTTAGLFSKAFYTKLASQSTLQEAFNAGVSIAISHGSSKDLYRMLMRPGIDPCCIVLGS
jgi:hypothetical protein